MLLARKPLVDPAAMGLSWPPDGPEDDIILSLASLTVVQAMDPCTRPLGAGSRLKYMEDFDMSIYIIFDQARAMPDCPTPEVLAPDNPERYDDE